MSELIQKVFDHGQIPGSLELAFVGDSVYDLYVRSHLVMEGGKVNALNKKAVAKVSAHGQSKSLERILPMLSEEELAIVRRAKNTRQTPTKNADKVEYASATALEALIGYLYLTNNTKRLKEILESAAGMEGNNHGV